MKTADAKHHKRRMRVVIKSKIRHYEACLKKLPNLDSEVLAAGIELFEDVEIFALWLCEPQAGLDGKIPLNVMRTAIGRSQIMRILSALKHGVYL